MTDTFISATPEQWKHWQQVHMLHADLLPVVSDLNLPISPDSKLTQVDGKTPSRVVRGHVVGVANWSKRQTKPDEIKQWAKDRRHGIGVVGRQVKAFDIDVDDRAKAAEIRAWIEKLTGPLPCRMRSNSGKCLLAFRMADPLPKSKILTDAGVVEILGHGQQFLLNGLHKSGVHYEWEGGLPAKIPTLTPAQVEAVKTGLQEAFGVKGGCSTSKPTIKPLKARRAADVADPAVAWLHAHGWVVGEHSDGMLDVRCPWERQHTTDSGPSATSYMPAGMGGQSRAGFKCMHAHCDGHDIFDFNRATGYENPADDFEVLPVLSAEEEAAQAIVRARNSAAAEAAAAAKRTPAEIIDHLRKLPRDEVVATWPSAATHLTKGAVQEVLDEVHRLTGIGPRRLAGELNDTKSALKAKATKAEVRRRAGTRTMIEHRPEDRTRQAAQVEAAIIAAAKPGDYIRFGDIPARVAVSALPYTHPIDDADGAPPPVLQIEPLDAVAVLGLVEGVVVFRETVGANSTAIAVPQAIIEILLKQKSAMAPAITGLVSHPIVLADGTILSEAGLHDPSGLFLAGAAVPGVRPFGQAEAVAALDRIKAQFLDGFEVATPADGDTLVAGLITGVQRRVLDQAPGLAVVASTQSSGKTTAVRRIHVILVGRDMPVSPFPQGDEAEVRKQLLSLLLRSPPLVCFDNLTDGTTFRSGAVAAAMTGPVLVQRVLGVSRDAEAPTNVLFTLTGNNLSLGADEVSRWLVARLAPTTARPEERTFAHPDVVAHALRMRPGILRDVVGVVAGYLRSGAAFPAATRFAAWDRMVRQPLIWAGASDMADAFRRNGDRSEDGLAHHALLDALNLLFPAGVEFGAVDVAQKLEWGGDGGTTAEGRLRSALLNLRAKDAQSERSIGRVLRAKADRISLVGEEPNTTPAVLRSRVLRGQVLYRVEVQT